MGSLTRRAQGGFSLIELLVTVAILGVLATIAIPSYNAYVLQSHRTEAITQMTSYRTALERCYSQNFSYLACPAASGGGVNTPNGYYALTFALAGGPAVSPSYLITATAIGSQTKDTTCITLTVDNTGLQKAYNSSGADSTQTCWGAK